MGIINHFMTGEHHLVELALTCSVEPVELVEHVEPAGVACGQLHGK